MNEFQKWLTEQGFYRVEGSLVWYLDGEHVSGAKLAHLLEEYKKTTTMSDLTKGVEHGIAEMQNIRDRHNAMILQIDEFFKAAKENGFIDHILQDLEQMKGKLGENIEILNLQIDKQIA